MTFFFKKYLKQNGPPTSYTWSHIIPVNGLIGGVAGVITLVLVGTPLITGRGPPSGISTSTEPPMSLRLTYTGRTKKENKTQKAVSQLVT